MLIKFLPPKLAATFTTGEQTMLRMLADESLAHGVCDRSLNETRGEGRSVSDVGEADHPSCLGAGFDF